MNDDKYNVMIVEDSLLITERIMKQLNDLEVVGKISHAETFAGALLLIESDIPDIVILDIGLPDKSGIYLLQMIRQKRLKTKVIVFTNEANDFYKRLCLRIGADEFLDKSHDFEKISELISNILT